MSLHRPHLHNKNLFALFQEKIGAEPPAFWDALPYSRYIRFAMDFSASSRSLSHSGRRRSLMFSDASAGGIDQTISLRGIVSSYDLCDLTQFRTLRERHNGVAR